MTQISKTTEAIRFQADINKLSSYFWNHNLRDYALFHFMLNTGRRISDTIALNVGDVSYIDKRGKFQIAQRFEVREKKTRKLASVVINDTAKRALKKYLNQRIRKNKKTMADFMREALFTSQKPRRNGEKRLRPESAWRIFSNAVEGTELDIHIGTHSLRKTCGYNLFCNGIDITLIQKFFNHSSR